MVEQSPILKAFVKLGKFLLEFCENENDIDALHHDSLFRAITLAEQQNGWFTKQNIRFALHQWGTVLTSKKLGSWLDGYAIPKNSTPNTIAIIMAGNIPLVGFHDFLSVIVTGNIALCKLSTNDKVLLPFLADHLIRLEPSLESRIAFTEGKLGDFDAVIATGSNNTSRYFEYYFGKKPNIIRKNRTSVAILSGKENQTQLYALGSDIFNYFGLGCRNVSKVFVPEGYDFDGFFKAIFEHKSVIEHHKYANNYDYNKAVYLMSEFKILDNGFLILKEDQDLHSPIAVLFYEEYDDLENLKERLKQERENLQCIVSESTISDEIAFGHTQKPALGDYADGIDTVNFLLKL